MICNLHHVKDSIIFLKNIPDNSYSACVTDGPYGISFMGKSWDNFDPENVAQKTEQHKSSINGREIRRPACEAGRYDRSIIANQKFQAFCEVWAREVLRTVKPGGILLSCCGPRTDHRMVSGIEDAGWIIRDSLKWIYGSGFPKSHNIGNAVDKLMGCSNRGHAISSGNKFHPSTGEARPSGEKLEKYKARTEQGEPWDGYGTALKPAYEPICVAMKPLDGTYAENVMKWGVGGLNIDDARIENIDRDNYAVSGDEGDPTVNCYGQRNRVAYIPDEQGRWPANILIDPYAAGYMDALADDRVSRFFYCSKASREEREAGLEDFFPQQVNDGRKTSIDNAYQRGDTLRKNIHPTVKPLNLVRYLIRLVKMPADNHILDLFMGSGSTGCACALEGIEEFTGLDKTAEYIQIAEARIKYWETVTRKGQDFDEKQEELFG